MRKRPPALTSPKPPSLAAAIILCLVEPHDRLSLLGDFTEEYSGLRHNRGRLIAGMWCWGQVFISVFSRIRSGSYWSLVMFKNYLKIALRNVKRHKGFSFINITGLAVGMACCMLILLWVQDELSYDRFHENQKELYRIVQKVQGEWWTGSPWALAPIMKEEYPEIIKATRIAIRRVLAAYGDKTDYQNACFVDQDFFDMFTFPFILGRAETAFPSPQSVVLTESAAQALFGPEDPIGQAVTINNRTKFTVTGVINDVPANSSYDFDILASVELFGDETLNSWAIGSSSFIQLQKNASLKEFRKKMSGIVMKYDRRTNQEILADIQPLNRIHLYDLRGGGLITYIYIFSTIAVFILLIACINFMNLSTARAGTRAREVGMRKVVGASRTHVIRQFYGESLLHSIGALLGALGLVLLFLPAFNNLAQKSLRMDFLTNIPLLLGMIGITLFTGFASGSYPALFLSAFHPSRVLKGGHSSGSRKPMLRKVLVVTQFTIAVVLLIGTVVMFKQLNFIRTKNMGYNRENVFSLPMNQTASRSYAAIKQEFLQNPQVVNVTAATSRPTTVGNINPVYWEGGGPEQYKTWNFVACDHDYIKTFDMELIAGRDFSQDFATDRLNYIVNEVAVKVMEMEDPIGKLFSIWENEGQIIGVVKNFHSRPLHNEIVPVVLTLNPDWGPSYLFVRISPENIQQTMTFLEGKWKQFVPNYPFVYAFLDESFEALYRADQRTGEIFKYFTFLAIIISCLGIFGLAAYTAEQRTKEIGVRKVLGATSPNIIRLISKEFLILLTIANGIAWPVAYLIMRRMLNNYAYRTGISAWIFPLAGVLTYGIALLTVSYQAFKAARIDPVQALRYE